MLKIKYLFPDLPELYSCPGDSGFDLRAAIERPLVIGGLGRATIPTGIAADFESKEGDDFSAELQVRPRSGHTLRGIVAQFGTIDLSYRGEIHVHVFNMNKDPVIIEPLERIAQLVVCPIYKPKVISVKELTHTKRGTKGFGSTGDK